MNNPLSVFNKINCIKENRKNIDIIQTRELLKLKQKFMDSLTNWNHLGSFECLEMYPFECDVIKGKADYPEYIKPYWNTRTKLVTETCAEIDCLDLHAAIECVCDICLSLIQKGFSFSVWYAEGQRSPHIRIYDFDELKLLNPMQREKAQQIFWTYICSRHIDKLDKSVWEDNHYLCMEYSIHWKHGTPFNLIFEYNSREEKCRN